MLKIQLGHDRKKLYFKIYSNRKCIKLFNILIIVALLYFDQIIAVFLSIKRLSTLNQILQTQPSER